MNNLTQLLSALATFRKSTPGTFRQIWGPELGPALWPAWVGSGRDVVAFYEVLTPPNRHNFEDYIASGIMEQAAAVAMVEEWLKIAP